MRPVARLLQLNAVDLILDSVKARLAEIAEGLKEPAALRAARAALGQAESALRDLRLRQQACEARQQDAAAKLARDEKRLYSGKVKDPKELQDLEADLAQTRRQRSQAEDELLEILIAVEAAEEKRKLAEQNLAGLASEWQTRQATLRAEQARLMKRLETEQTRQAAVRAAAPAQLLPMYDSLRTRKGGHAVSTLLDNEVCSECKVAVSPTTRAAVLSDSDELVYCENCGRLLFGE
jgi:uncharacterized protein